MSASAVETVEQSSHSKAVEQAKQFAEMDMTPRDVIAIAGYKWPQHLPTWDDAIRVMAEAHMRLTGAPSRPHPIIVEPVRPLPGELIHELPPLRFVTCSCGTEFQTTQDFRFCPLCRMRAGRMGTDGFTGEITTPVPSIGVGG